MARVLLIEPDKVLAASCEKIFLNNGFDVDLCDDAQDGIDKIDKNIPNLIIMEVQLANHNGVEFLYELRSYPEWKNIPVIILSMVPYQDMNISYLKNNLGIIEYYYKPKTQLDKLVKSARSIIDENN